eukprot:TRINITY_DN7280_c0_g1_i16.p1 TRINITY_DN7280_c0_g1~~TRINITY_DN7280_c0_g1_i16.p1  ORF type:complete len:615 (-),score=164.41 TRINITY_DN7280_c0_g1_i16:148-1860(-)
MDSTTIKQRWTPLHFASYYGRCEIVKILLDKLSPVSIMLVDTQGRDALYLAAMGGHADVVKLLLGVNCKPLSHAFDGSSPVSVAMSRGHTRCVVFLSSALQQAVIHHKIHGSPQIWSVPSSRKAFPLLQAVTTSNLETVEKTLISLSREGSDLLSLIREHDHFRVNALHVAAWKGYTGVALFLLGKDPTLLNTRDCKGQTPLHYAVRSCSLETVKMILDFHLPSHVSSTSAFGTTSSSISLEKCFPVELEAQNEFGQTPLFYVLKLLSSCDFSDNCDKLDGLPFAKDWHDLMAIKEVLENHGAIPPQLSFYSNIPQNPKSHYLQSVDGDGDDNDDCVEGEGRRWKLDEMSKSREEVENVIREEETRALEEKEEEERILRLFTKPKAQGKDMTMPTDQMTTSCGPTKKRKFMDSRAEKLSHPVQDALQPLPSQLLPLQPLPPQQPLQDPFFKPMSSINFNTFDIQNRARFSLERVDEPTPHVKPGSISKLMDRANTFKSTEQPRSVLGQFFMKLSRLHELGRISHTEKDALKTLAIKQDKAIFAATLALSIDQDETEFLDTLHKICHLALA